MKGYWKAAELTIEKERQISKIASYNSGLRQIRNVRIYDDIFLSRAS